MLSDRAQRHELPGRAGGHLRAVIRDREQEPANLLAVGAEVEAVIGQACVDALKQAFGLQRCGEGDLDLVEVSSDETTSVIHLRETRTSTISTAIPARVKCVVS